MTEEEPKENHKKELPTHFYDVPKTEQDWEYEDYNDEVSADYASQGPLGMDKESYLEMLQSFSEFGRDRSRFWNMLVEFVPKSGFQLPQDRPTVILDLACGTCDEGAILEDYFYGKTRTGPGEIEHADVQYYGIDSDPESIKQAISNNEGPYDEKERRRKLPSNFHFEVGDATKLDNYPSLPKQADVIVIKHQQLVGGPDYEYNDEIAKEIWRKIFQQAIERIAPEGIIIITSYYEFENEETARLIEELGGQVIVNETNPHSRSLIDERDPEIKDGNKDYKILIAKRR